MELGGDEAGSIVLEFGLNTSISVIEKSCLAKHISPRNILQAAARGKRPSITLRRRKKKDQQREFKNR